MALPLEQTTDLTDNEIRERSLEALRQLEIDDHGDRYPSQLSGGMQKRLALARAIVTRPELVFFDEPTAGLDPLRRNAVFAMIAKYQRQFGFTALIVTHDVVEALVASDRVALLDQGRICFEGTPAEFSASTHPVVLRFPRQCRRTWQALSLPSVVRRLSIRRLMKQGKLELLVGIFVLLGIAAVAYLTMKLGAGSLIGGDTYLVEARFANAGGLAQWQQRARGWRDCRTSGRGASGSCGLQRHRHPSSPRGAPASDGFHGGHQNRWADRREVCIPFSRGG